MEDQFANILQRNYGLKTVGKSASYGPRSDERASARGLDRGKSVGSGLGRINQSAAAAVLLAGDNLGSLSKSARQSDPPLTYGSGGDRGFRGPSKSTSVGGFDDIFGGARSGSASSSSFAEFLDGSVGKSTAASSESPNNEDIPAVASEGRSGPKEESTRSTNEQGHGIVSDGPAHCGNVDGPASSFTASVGVQSIEATEEGVRRRSFRSGESRRSTEGEFLDSLMKEPKGSAQAGSIPSPLDSPRPQTPKCTVSESGESPLKGSFMRGFGRSRTARSATQLSTGTGDSQGEVSAGETTNGLRGNRSNHRTTSGSSSLSMDGSEVESIGRPDSTTGFTIPASNGTAFPDLNEPYAPPSVGLPAKRSSEVKVSSPEADSGETLRSSSDQFPRTPKTPGAASPEAKDSPSSGPGPFAPESRGDVSGQEASAEESMPARRAVDLNPTGSPTVSPSYVQRSRKSTNRPNGSASNVEEPLTKFEVNLATGGASGGSGRGRRKSDSLADVWLTVDQIRLVTQPSSWPAPSRAPPPPPHARRYSGSGGHRPGQRSEPPETRKDQASERPEATETDKQRSSPSGGASGTDTLQSGRKVQQGVDVERSQSGARRQVYGSERANGGAHKVGENQKTGYVLPEVTVVDLGPEETRPSREERRRTREQMERDRRRAKREEERVREKERVQKEGLAESMLKDTQASGVRDGSEARGGRREKVFDPRDSISNDTDTSGSRESSRPREGRREKVFDPRESIPNDTDGSGGRQPSRPREGRREKVFDSRESIPRERHSVETASRRDEKDAQYRVLRQQEKEFRARLARQEEARDRESERSGEKLRRSAEKAALEAQERAERAAVERAVQEAHERAERAARHRAAAAREKERMKEKERERERERDREEEKLRDRLREKERGLAEQLRSRDSFRATSEPRQRPTVSGNSPSGLSRFSSGGSLSNLSGPPDARNSPSAQKAVDDWTNLYSQSSSGIPERFQEIPGEPADRRKLRLEKQMLIEERAAAALREKNMRDLALQREQEERQRFAGSLDADVRRWSVGKEGNLRALLSTLHVMLWPECNWKIVSMSDLVSAPSVKKAYQRAILCVHPDKVQQKGANVKQKYIAEKVFDLLKDAYAKFNSELSY